jgi:hypothetical protein
VLSAVSAIKISARIIAAATVALGLVASCGQLLGDYEVIRPGLLPADAGTEPSGPVVICEPGITECAGRALQLCTDDGTGWATLEICETADLCETSDNSTVSACLEPTCAVDQMSCDGNMLRLCNTMRTGWELFDTCETAAHCDAGNRQCLPAPCEPGDRRCNVGNLERCNDTRTAWEPLDTCETNELCEATLVPVATTGEVVSPTQLLPPSAPPPANSEGPTGCLQPVCIPREVRCDVNRLLACNAGQTALSLFEECATPKLCDASIAYTGRRGSPRCVRPTCAPGEHRCTDAGVLEVCNADRDGYDPIEACIGAPFCNAVAADNGQPGCEDAPCEAGEMQCNGPQIQVCTADRTRFDPLGAACETRGLCNDDNDRGAFCQVAACQRGPFSGTEFRCEAATLLRCNDQHTGYDPIGNCATPGLCNAALGFSGCQPPVCFPGETRCNGNFVQRCNEQRTGFDNIEQCVAGTCDSALGRCADPCVVGSARCNAQGNLEECRNLLVGREITARCGSPQLCDATARQCRTPPQGCTADGVRRCRQQGQTSVLEECTDGRSRFVTLDTCAAGEVCDPNDISCDACVQGSEPTCEGNNNLAICSSNGQTETNTNCPNGCQTVTPGADRCRNCVPGAVSCDGFQLVVCRQRNGTEVPDRENCASNALCQQTIQNCTGENCRCQQGVCDPGERQCNGGQPEVCNAGQTAFAPDGPNCGVGNCNPQTARCFACGVGDVTCNAGVLFGCAADRSGFTERLGAQRCLRDNNGHRSQSCNGNQLIDSRCPGGSPICVDGFGCQECDPGDFESECTTVGGVAGTTECLGGDVQSFACTGAGACVDAVCEGDGDCNTQSSAPGTPCARGNARGVCDGAPLPTCVECLQNPAAGNCDDGNPCTDDSCSGTRCNHPNNTRPCTLNNGGGMGICSAGSCVPPAICTPNVTRRCTGAVLERCNGTGTGFVLEATCGSAALCSTAGCGTPCGPANQCVSGCTPDLTGCNQCRPADCSGRDNATCANRVCSGTQCILGAPECRAELCIGGICRDCANDDDCPGALVCDLGSNTCVPPRPQCDPAACPFPNQCNPNGSCVVCDNEATCPDTPGSCNISVCGANGCEDTPGPLGAECPNGQCDADGNCLPLAEPPGGEDPDQGGGDPGNGNGGGNSILCNGVCEALDALLCPEDCD